MINKKFWITSLILLLSLCVLSACGGSSTASASAASTDSGNGGQGQQGPRFTSAYLTNTYDNALPVTLQLTLGTMKLEGTPNAVTADQAAKLLPLWQSMQSGNIQNAAEAAAVYKQIEATMTPAQMQGIAGMKLTRTDLQDWAKSQGIQLPQFLTLSPEAMATRRAQLQAQGGQGGQSSGQGGQGNGQGGQRQGGQGSGQRGQRGNVMLNPLIKLLTTRAGK